MNTTETITLYRIETPCHEGPFNTDECTLNIESHTCPQDMELSHAAEDAVATGDCFYFFREFERLAEVFSIVGESSFRVVQVDVPCDLEFVKYFKLQDCQVILDSDTYLNYYEQGKVVVRDDLTKLITK